MIRDNVEIVPLDSPIAPYELYSACQVDAEIPFEDEDEESSMVGFPGSVAFASAKTLLGRLRSGAEGEGRACTVPGRS